MASNEQSYNHTAPRGRWSLEETVTTLDGALVGVIGAGEADEALTALAYEVGARLARAGCVLVNGGLGGVMAASSRGAAEAGGLTVGILPGPSADDANPHVRIPVVTHMGHARNVIIAHSAGALIAVGGSHGTRSEVSIGLKLGRPVISLQSFDFDPAIRVATTPAEAVAMALDALAECA